MSQEMTNLTERAGRIMEAMAQSIMNATEAAVEKIDMAVEMARIKVKMETFGAVLNMIAVQKATLLERKEVLKGDPGNGPMIAVIDQQLLMLTKQELAVMTKAGCPDEVAQKTVQLLDGPAVEEAPKAGRNGKHNRIITEHCP